MDIHHLDENTRILGERYAGIVIRDDKLLLIHRIKNGFDYYVFPGGHRRRDESGGQTVVREVLEETAVEVIDPRLAIKFSDADSHNTNYYYLCTWVSGLHPHLNGEEGESDPQVNFYEPMWVDISGLADLNILPLFAKNWLLNYFSKRTPKKSLWLT